MTQRCKGGFAITTDAGPRVYPAGALVGDDDPILRTHGHLFEPVEAQVQRQEEAPRSVTAAVETATAAPGEVRQVVAPPEVARPTIGAGRRAGRKDGDEK